ncbi:hypothetical protein BGX27_009495 [Mortierella sp. AM989]|nr:hypothetical protein BGX27_009495 [Mortierella sp. AM989]
MAYVTLDESTLYIKGGMRADGSSSNQFYSLDLTKDWDVSNPPWKPLNLGVGSRMPPYGPHHSLVISKDKKSLIYWAIEHGIYVYDIASDSWVSQYPASNATSQWGGLRAVASPYTGLIYVPSGGDSGNTMLEIDLAMNITRGSTMPAKLKGVSNYSIVWCTVRGTFLLFGGEFYHPELAFAHPPNTAFYQYFPITQEWTEIAWGDGMRCFGRQFYSMGRYIN